MKDKLPIIANRLSTDVLISEDKKKFICFQQYEGRNNQLCTFFDVVNGQNQPLNLNINRVIRAQKLLKQYPSVVIMNADGQKIIIDCISKILAFNPDEEIKGIIQYEYDKDLNYNILSLFYDNIEPQTHILQIESEPISIFNFLVLYSVILERGAIISINDRIEKVLHLPILDPQFGYIGETIAETIYFSRLNQIRKAWPELGIVLIVKNSKIKIYSEILKYEYKNEIPFMLRCHKNHDTNDIMLTSTHICQKY